MSFNYEDYENNSKDITGSKNSNDPSQYDSFFIKSFDEEKFNYTEILKTKKKLFITFPNSEISISILTKSIQKILSLIEIDKKNLEYLYSSYITAVLEKDDEYTISKINQSNTGENSGVLDFIFMKLLDQTKIYQIRFLSKRNNIRKMLLNYDINADKIIIKSKSLEKIFHQLQKNIYDMSDYINILILKMDDSMFDSIDVKGKIFENYLRDDFESSFLGIKNFEYKLKIPKKVRKLNIDNMDKLFENVLSHLDNLMIKQEEFISNFDNSKNTYEDLNNSNLEEECKRNENGLICKCESDFCSTCKIF